MLSEEMFNESCKTRVANCIYAAGNGNILIKVQYHVKQYLQVKVTLAPERFA